MRFLIKAQSTQTTDGVLTDVGRKVVSGYAGNWVRGTRDLDAERKYPELAGVFWDIRLDDTLAREYAMRED